MIPLGLGLAVVVLVVAAFLLRRVLKLLVWLAVAVVVGVGIPGVVLGVLFLVVHVGSVR